MATQSWVCPQQVTLPLELKQVPVATVQVSVPLAQGAVQVWVAETSVGPPQVARNTTVINPIITKALRMDSPLRYESGCPGFSPSSSPVPGRPGCAHQSGLTYMIGPSFLDSACGRSRSRS